jgi:hypothetical protein
MGHPIIIGYINCSGCAFHEMLWDFSRIATHPVREENPNAMALSVVEGDDTQ